MGGSTPNAHLDPDHCDAVIPERAVERALGTIGVGLTVPKEIFFVLDTEN